MTMIFNGAELEEIVFNGVDCEKVYFNGTLVFEKSTHTHILTVGSIQFYEMRYGVSPYYGVGNITPPTAFGGVVEEILWFQGDSSQYGSATLYI